MIAGHRNVAIAATMHCGGQLREASDSGVALSETVKQTSGVNMANTTSCPTSAGKGRTRSRRYQRMPPNIFATKHTRQAAVRVVVGRSSQELWLWELAMPSIRTRYRTIRQSATESVEAQPALFCFSDCLWPGSLEAKGRKSTRLPQHERHRRPRGEPHLGEAGKCPKMGREVSLIEISSHLHLNCQHPAHWPGRWSFAVKPF